MFKLDKLFKHFENFMKFLFNLKKDKKVPCLMYHNVVKEHRENIISTKEFEEHMKCIKDRTTYKMEDLEKVNYKLDESSALVTFDDGFKNTYIEVFPILKKYNVKATIFLNTKYIGKDEDYINWEEAKEMYESGLVDFQLHTHSHEPVIRKLQVNNFFNEETEDVIKREYFSLYKKSFLKEKSVENFDFRNFEYNGLPMFKIRSKIAIKGFRPNENFINEYKKIVENSEFEKMDFKEKKKYLNKIFAQNKEKLFEVVTDEEFLKNLEYEISENKRMIEQNLNKKAEYLAFPWGHRYDREKIEKLGVKGFIYTSEKFNSTNIDYRKINRFNGDDIRDFNLFVKKLEI